MVTLKNEKSYSESVKSLSMSEMKNDAVVQEMLIDMIIQEAVLTTKKNILAKQIDEALDKKNKPLFLKLSSEMNVLLKQFGNWNAWFKNSLMIKKASHNAGRLFWLSSLFMKHPHDLGCFGYIDKSIRIDFFYHRFYIG